MKSLVLSICLLLTGYCQQITFSGTVRDFETNTPLHSASIVLLGTNQGVMTDADGFFQIVLKVSESTKISISYLGFETSILSREDVLSRNGTIFQMRRIAIPSQTIIVHGTIPERDNQFSAFSKIEHAAITSNHLQQDVPEFLSAEPSIISYSEDGNGLGYNYLSIRGFDQRRVAVMVNGIPQNDPEDHNVYWIDFNDILGSTEFIQVQRSSGGGIFGYPAVGGAINIVTNSLSAEPKITVSSLLGSFNTRKYAVDFSSGIVNAKYSFTAKFSKTLSSGYREHAWVDLNSYYLSAVRFDDALTSQVNIYGGPFRDGLTYMGLPKFIIEKRDPDPANGDISRRSNLSYWQQRNDKIKYAYDRRSDQQEYFSQPHYELLNEYALNKSLKFNSALFLVIGEGYFDDDGTGYPFSYFRLTPSNGFNVAGDPDTIYTSTTLIRAQVENKQFGWLPKMSYSFSEGVVRAGFEFRKHSSVHWGNIQYSDQGPAGLTPDFKYYYYRGGKDIAGMFINAEYKALKNLNTFAELQISYFKYRIYDEQFAHNDFTIKNVFFNPRFGVNYTIDEKSNLYFSFAQVSREPRLKNYYDAAESSGGAVPQFQTLGNGAYDYTNPLVKPERMTALELGYIWNHPRISVSLNGYYMSFKDEIVKNGQIDRFGNPITGNVPSTVHTGLEISMNLKPIDKLECILNATYSKNSIRSGNTFFTYNNNTVRAALDGNHISGFPDFLLSAQVNYAIDPIQFNISTRYVGEFFSNNYDIGQSELLQKYPGFLEYSDNKNEAYLLFDFLLYGVIKNIPGVQALRIDFQVRNIFDVLYSQYAVGKEFFPGAERNFTAGLRITF